MKGDRQFIASFASSALLMQRMCVVPIVPTRLTGFSHMRLREHFGSYAGGLEHALALATLAHATQRACGAQTGAHPVRMALVLPEADTDARTVALLHDVVEDSGLTLDDLRKEGFPEHIVAAVDALQHRQASVSAIDDQRIARYDSALEIFDMAS